MRLVQVCNSTVDGVLDGGHARVIALDKWVDSIKGTRIVIKNSRWDSSRLYRNTLPLRLALELKRARPDILLVRYPACPFFMHEERDEDVLRATIFLSLINTFVLSTGTRLVVDLTDLFRCWAGKRLNDRLLARLERSVFGLATEVWVCSHEMGQWLAEEYGLDSAKMRDVLNGNFREQSDDPDLLNRIGSGTVNMLYAGDLLPGVRGVEEMVGAFTAEVKSEAARLVLCGGNGDWVADFSKDPRVIYLGLLSPSQLNSVARSCHVGLVPQYEAGYLQLVFPTKMGLYLSTGLPVVVTQCREVAEFVKKHKCGVVTPFEQLGRCMDSLANRLESLDAEKLSAQAIGESFYWDRVYGDALAALLEGQGISYRSPTRS